MATKNIAPFSFNTFCVHLTQYADTASDAQHMRAYLTEYAPRMTAAQKIDADGRVVAYLEDKYGVEGTASKRPEFSGWTFNAPKDSDADMVRAMSSARVALHKARAILKGKQAKTAEPIDKMDRAYATLAKAIKAGDKGAAKRVRQLVLLLGA